MNILFKIAKIVFGVFAAKIAITARRRTVTYVI
jgi:hypothetical protein